MIAAVTLCTAAVFVCKGADMVKNTTELLSQYDGLKLSILWLAPKGRSEGILQISHGMSENKERYLPFIKYMAQRGYVCVIHDHRGHGQSVLDREDLGYMYGGKNTALVRDLHQVSLWAKEKFPGLPLYLLGHSMGSLIARNYLKDYDDEIDKLILTGPPCRNTAAGLGLLIARMEKRICGAHHRSKLLETMSFGMFARRFRQEESRFAWVCANRQVVEEYEASQDCGFTFTADAYESLMLLMKATYSRKGWKVKHPKLPILFLAGQEDPCVGNGRKFVQELQHMKRVGYKKLTGKMYPGMRHEILNETEKYTVYKNIYEYLKRE